MNFRQLLISFLCLFSISITSAAEYNFTPRERDAHKVKNFSPQVYLFNQKGELIHYSNRFFPALKKAFANTEPVTNADKLKKNLLSLTQAPQDFNDYDFTLFFLAYDESIGPCPPCRKQEKIIEKIKDKMKDKKINHHIVNIIQETYYIDD
ncbi:hypothetical protein SG34_024140 [Thalassomonas viridans]|uniref:Uncharacterized protein n=1 Tax=Thalassomonas viridans TaxID=137584 RepID=A0AAE9Z0N9_9GAMM|nr:hypothetical protein [Thalassomonas viridans]WDE04398.1 hypothetical protein SG34_024140 [Thalassomonas viridans]